MRTKTLTHTHGGKKRKKRMRTQSMESHAIYGSTQNPLLLLLFFMKNAQKSIEQKNAERKEYNDDDRNDIN